MNLTRSVVAILFCLPLLAAGLTGCPGGGGDDGGVGDGDGDTGDGDGDTGDGDGDTGDGDGDTGDGDGDTGDGDGDVGDGDGDGDGDIGDGDGDGDGDPLLSLTLTGTVYDFGLQVPTVGNATITALQILPYPDVVTDGTDFTLSNVANNSIFTILVGLPPDYESTYNAQVAVGDQDVVRNVEAVSTSWLDVASTTHGVTLQPGTGTVIARCTDAAGDAVSGVPAAAFYIDNTAPPETPAFLNGARGAVAVGTQTGAQGYVVLYNVPFGQVTLQEAPASGWTIVGGPATVSTGAVTLLDVSCIEGDILIPTGLSFAADIYPIFTDRGCTDCHFGQAQGAAGGGLSLNAGVNNVYDEVATEESPTYSELRVNLLDPEASVLLAVPSNAIGQHPFQALTGLADPDYLDILGWITDGAPDN